MVSFRTVTAVLENQVTKALILMNAIDRVYVLIRPCWQQVDTRGIGLTDGGTRELKRNIRQLECPLGVIAIALSGVVLTTGRTDSRVRSRAEIVL